MSDDIVARSDALDEKIANTDIETTVAGLVAYGARNRRLIRWLTASVVFDVFLSIAIGVGGLVVKDTSERADTAAAEASALAHQIDRNSQNVRDACLAGNEFRADQVKLWDFVIELSASPQPDDTADEIERQRVQTAQFEKFLRETFAPRDCPGVP